METTEKEAMPPAVPSGSSSKAPFKRGRTKKKGKGKRTLS